MRKGILILGLMTIIGCIQKQSFTNVDLKQQLTVGDFSYSARYIPISHQVLKEVDFNTSDANDMV